MFKIIRNIFIFLFILVLLIAAGVGYARYIEPHRLSVYEEVLYSPKLAEDQVLTVGIFSDTHFSDYYTIEDFQKVIDTFNDMQPDVIFFVGDLIDVYDEYSMKYNVDEISSALGQLSAPMGKYAVSGNHDYADGAENAYKGIMEDGGFIVMENSSLVLPISDGDKANYVLTCIDDYAIGHGDPNIVYGNLVEDYNIVLCHEPDVIDTILDANIDLMIAGHTHGGQVRLPYLTNYFLPLYGQKYIYGDYSFENAATTHLFVTAGIGTTKLPYRFNACPEVVKLTISGATE